MVMRLGKCWWRILKCCSTPLFPQLEKANNFKEMLRVFLITVFASSFLLSWRNTKGCYWWWIRVLPESFQSSSTSWCVQHYEEKSQHTYKLWKKLISRVTKFTWRIQNLWWFTYQRKYHPTIYSNYLNLPL